MEEFDFHVVHRAGSLHNNADALSRRPSVAEGIEVDRPFDKCNRLVRNIFLNEPIPMTDWSGEEVTAVD